MLTLKRYFASLAVLLVACGTYALAIAPLVEPPPPRKKQSAASVPAATTTLSLEADLARLFPEGAWQRSDPKIIETEQCTLLIRDYLPTPDGGLELRPCTLIFHAAAGREPTSGEVVRRPIVLDAPGGAVLEFDEPLDPVRARFGSLERGQLTGPIKIFSPPTKADGSDALQLTTHDVRLDLDHNRIYTPHEVDFRFGESFGQGRDLTILLAPKQQLPAPASESPPLGGVQSLRLAHIERLQVAMQGGGLLGEMLGKGDAKKSPVADAPLEIRCRGPFHLDVVQHEASFEEQVEVVRAAPGMPVDRLRCERLVLEFSLERGKDAGGRPTANDDVGDSPTKAGKLAGEPVASDDPLGGRIQRIVADGYPATLEAPTSGVRASARRMEFSLAKRRIALLPDRPPTPGEVVPRPRIEEVSLQQHDQHFVARELQYEMAERGRLGRLFAAGPGRLRLLQDAGPAQQIVTAQWKDELRIRPHERNQVISLVGEASIGLEPLARFAAKEIHLWVLEVPVGTPPTAAEDTAGGKPADQRSRTRYTMLPDRLLATRSVTLRSPQLDADTSRLEAWFIHRPPKPAEGPEAQPAPPVEPMPPLREPIARAAWNGERPERPRSEELNVPPAIRPPKVQKFHAEGGLIQLQLVMQGRDFELEDLTIRDHARIHETRTQEPGQEPFHVSGELVKLRQGTTPQATIVVSGQPATVGGRGLVLIGREINIHRGENRLWIDGPGEATLPVPDGDSLSLVPGSSAPPPPIVRQPGPMPKASSEPPQKLHVVWQQGMSFDGLVARLAGQVQARTANQAGPSQVALAQTLDAALSERIDFTELVADKQLELGRLELAGNVYLESRSYDEDGNKTSHEQLQVPSLTIDRAAGTLHAPGPGWASTVRRSNGTVPGLPGAAPRSPQLPASPPNDKPALISVHIAFERQIVGNLARHEIEFQHHVRTTYSPAKEFTDLIKAERFADLPEQGLLMSSDRLTLREIVLSPAQSWLELDAGGNTVVEGKSFTVQAAHVRYTSDKELLTIEGESRSDARVWYETIPGQPRGHAAARRFRYWLRDEAFEGEEFSVGGFEWAGGKLKLPGLR